MSQDEVFVLLASTVVAIVGWGSWYVTMLMANRLGSERSPTRPILALSPLLCLAGISVLLHTAASFDVRNDPVYLVFYVVFGAAWIAVGRALFRLFGISWRYDALDLRNPAAAWTVAGGLSGLAACYAGANVGDGPGWWCVLFAGGLGTAAWILSWGVVQAAAGLAETITVERDRDTGIRTGAFLLAAGVLCGRGAAGDWTSAERTLIEFADAWPLLPLVAGAAVIERLASAERNRPQAPSATRLPGWPIALVYIGFAVICVLVLPGPAENPAYGIPPGATLTP